MFFARFVRFRRSARFALAQVSTLKALGAEVVRTPTEAAWDDPRSNIMVARRLAGEILDAHILDQYNNINNPLAHRATAEEIIEAVSGGASALGGVLESATNAMQNLGLGTGAGERPLTPATTPDASPLHVPTSINGSTNAHAHANRGDADIQHASLPTSSSPVVDVLIAGVGTGGTISGIAARLKEKDHNPNLYVVGVDPVGSTLAVPAELNTLPEGSDGQYKIEGIGYVSPNWASAEGSSSRIDFLPLFIALRCLSRSLRTLRTLTPPRWTSP